MIDTTTSKGRRHCPLIQANLFFRWANPLYFATTSYENRCLKGYCSPCCATRHPRHRKQRSWCKFRKFLYIFTYSNTVLPRRHTLSSEGRANVSHVFYRLDRVWCAARYRLVKAKLLPASPRLLATGHEEFPFSGRYPGKSNVQKRSHAQLFLVSMMKFCKFVVVSGTIITFSYY